MLLLRVVAVSLCNWMGVDLEFGDGFHGLFLGWGVSGDLELGTVYGSWR